MFGIVGLGNPGRRYRKTRHNIGFMLVDAIADSRNIKVDSWRCRSLVGELSISGHDVVLVKPQTYMNKSGEAVLDLMEAYPLETGNLLVVYDDVALPLGKLRLKRRGSAGGHNGMQSVLSLVETEEIPRLRMGVGSDTRKDDLAAFVLSRFRWRERHQVRDTLASGQQTVEWLIQDGMDMAMNRTNRTESG